MKKVILGLLFVTSLFGQVNRVLTISPSAEETTLGNQSLAFRNPAINHFNLDTTTNVSFTNVQWLKNIVDDMGYNYVDVRWKNLGFNLLHFDYGEQKQTDVFGTVNGSFSPTTTKLGVSWGTPLYYKGNKLDSVSIGVEGKAIFHDLHTEKTDGMLFDVGIHMDDFWKKLDMDIMIANFGIMTKMNGYEIDIPTSLNLGVNIPIRQWNIYNQWNIYSEYYTMGQGISYNFRDTFWFRAGFFSDIDHQLNYPSIGMGFEYDKYNIGLGFISGDDTHPLKDSMLLTINVEI